MQLCPILYIINIVLCVNIKIVLKYFFFGIINMDKTQMIPSYKLHADEQG